MKKVFLKAYTKNNLGDDLFIDIIVRRYPNVKFYIYTSQQYNFSYDNLKIYCSKFSQLINKMLKLITLRKFSLEKILEHRADYVVLIGGSMFIENPNKSIETSNYLLDVKKNYMILGSNFGPYYNESFYNYYYKVFVNSLDVCFRDSYSYNLYSNIKNVRYERDIIFSYDNRKIINKTEKKTVAISLIDLMRKGKICAFKEKYDEKIIELIKYFQEKQYKVYLISFCKYEGDEDEINHIINKLESRDNIEICNYKDDITQPLKIIASSEYVIATRFHAMVLGFLYNKKVLPIIYSEKTRNVLEDLNYKGLCIDIKDIDKFNVCNIENRITKLDGNINMIKKSSEKQFKVLDMVLKK